ncbi:MAG: ferrous iron transport protein B [Desulfurococcaceae archaeon]
MKRLLVALIGQPNVGKSTLFNAITRGHVIVTNWPGTTVEKHEATVTYGDHEVVVVDLPGVYGLTYSTLEEKISRDFILKDKPDLVIVLVDSLALERTMYLAIEVLELTGKAVVAVTKVDEAHSKGIHINYELLEKALGAPVIPVSAVKGLGLRELLNSVVRYAEVENKLLLVNYGELNTFIESLTSILQEANIKLNYPHRWAAIKYLEGDPEVTKQLEALGKDLYERLKGIREEAIKRSGQDLAALMSRKRFEFVESIVRGAVIRKCIQTRREGRLLRVFYNPYLAPLVSLALLISIFVTVFVVNTGYPLTALFESMGLHQASMWLSEHSLFSMMERALEALSRGIYSIAGYTTISRFLVEAVLGGVSVILLFTPLILLVLVVIGMLEDSGLMPRIAVGLHALAQKVGLSGHALLPITLSFGCNVPGILATRATPNEVERVRLVMLLSFIPCQARLIILLAIASSLGGFAGVALLPLAYVVSFTVLIMINWVLYKLAERLGEAITPEILLELPPVHKPIFKVVWWYAWFHLKHFLVKAGMVILAANAVAWFFVNANHSLRLTGSVNESLAATASRSISVLLVPLGVVGDNAWIVAYALLMGFIAKELFLTTLISATGTTTVKEAFSVLQLTPASIVAMAVFVSLYVPCLATMVTMYSETKSFKLVLKSVLLINVTAYFTSLLVYSILNYIV